MARAYNRGAMGHLHYVFLCRDCSIPIWLHAEMLGRPFEPQGVRSMEPDAIAVVCPNCNHVRSYSLVEKSPSYDPTGTVVFENHVAATVPLGLLECVQGTCRTPLPLCGVKSIPTDEEDKREMLHSWIWGDDVICPNGHRVLKPKILSA